MTRSPQTFEKRQREKRKQEKRLLKQEQRLERNAEKRLAKDQEPAEGEQPLDGAPQAPEPTDADGHADPQAPSPPS